MLSIKLPHFSISRNHSFVGEIFCVILRKRISISAFGPWGSWSECSRSCGGGSRMKERPIIGGKLGDFGCNDISLVTENCNTCSCAGKNLFYMT